MMKKLLLLAGIACTFNAHALTRTALVNNGNWLTAATWSGNAVPSATDTVVIPTGIRVALSLSNVSYTPWNNPIMIAVRGTLEMTGANPYFSNPVTIEVFPGGTMYDNTMFSEYHLTPVSRLIVRSGAAYNAAWGNSNILSLQPGSTPPNIMLPLPTIPPFTLTVSNGTMTFTPTVPLPLTLVTFGAVRQAGQVKLEWKTAAEDRTAYFDVERSSDGKSFTSIANVKANGRAINNYEATDATPAEGNNLYRLKMADADGTYTYSAVVSLLNLASEALVYPNPAGNVLHVKGIREQALIIHNVAGQTVLRSTVGKGDATLDISALPNGVYYLQTDGQQIRFVKSKP